MKVQLQSNFRGWITYDFPQVETLEEAAYLAAVDATHLEPDNHTYVIETDKTFQWGGKQVKFSSVKFFRNEKSERDYPYRWSKLAEPDYWFAMIFRAVPSDEELAKEKEEGCI